MIEISEALLSLEEPKANCPNCGKPINECKYQHLLDISKIAVKYIDRDFTELLQAFYSAIDAAEKDLKERSLL